jgi:ankyrin repeat protein
MDDWFEVEKLHIAADEGDLDEVRRLVSEGYPVTEFDELSMTPLHYAAKGNHLEMARFLIEAGADVNAREEAKIGETPLGEVAANCSYEMAELLIKAGADPTIPGWMQLTALHRAARRKREVGQRVYALLLAVAKEQFGHEG